jgi:NAD-dependent deacetylase
MKKLVVLTGSGMSSESGLKTFRESGGLWEDYDVMEVASFTGWTKNMDLVLRFYNERRAQLKDAVPNEGHKLLADLEKYFDLQIITQNVDNLHEKAGSTKVLHLHGILTRVRSTGDPDLVYEIGYKPIYAGDTCEKGFQLRPDIVWFGEAVPAIEEAAAITSAADIFVVIGTSMVVYPAAGLIDFAPKNVPVFLIDPNDVAVPIYRHINFIKEKAGKGVAVLKERLLKEYLEA